MGSALLQYLQPGESIQRVKTGWTDDFTDHHGRRFAAHFDLGNMRPKEELRPVGFDPPWLPPMRFIKWDRHGGFRFSWDYETMANELAEETRDYYARVMDFMLEHMKDYVAEHGIPKVGEPVPNMVLRSPIGPPPLSPAIALACQAGDPWALGVPGAPVNEMLQATLAQSRSSSGRSILDEVKARMTAMVGENAVPTLAPDLDPAQQRARSIKDIAAPHAEITYQEFLNECRAKGMAMPDIYSAWSAHKAFLAEQAA